MSRTFIKEWVEKIDENNFITHKLRNGKEKTIVGRKTTTAYNDDSNSIIPCYRYLISDNQGKSFDILVDIENEQKIYYKEIKSDESIIKTNYHYNKYDKLEGKEIKTLLIQEGEIIDNGTKYEAYRYLHLDMISDKYLDRMKYLKVINEFKSDDGNTVIAEIVPSDINYFKCTIKSEFNYILLYNTNVIKTKAFNEKIYRENNQLITESVEFTIDKFTYKIINYTTKNKLKLIVKTDREDELTLSERFFYDTQNKDINFYQLFAAIALREKTLLGIKSDNPEKYFFILLRDLEELVKFNFIKEENRKEEEIKEYEM